MQGTLKTIGSLTVLKIIAAITGLVYSVLQVRYFGANAAMDAYFVALTAVYVITSIVQGGQLAEVFLPEYLKVKSEQSAAQAHQLFSAMMNRVLVVVAVFSFVVYFLAPFLIQVLGVGLPQEYQVLATDLFRVALLLILFTLFSAFVSATLNAEHVYGRTELTGLINSLLSLILIVLFHQVVGLWILVYALLAGKVVELATGIFFLKKAGVRYYAIWRVADYDLNRFFKVLFVTSGYVGATQFYTTVLTAATSLLPEGTLSIFNYVKQLSTKASGIVLMPISTIFFSKFATLVAQHKANLTSYLTKPLMAMLVIAGTMLALIILVGNELLSLLWSEKTLTPTDFKLAYLMLVLNFAGIFISAIGGIFRKSAISMGAPKPLYIRWIGVQLFCAGYSYGIITAFGTLGLISILPLNMILMAVVSIYSAYREGIDVSVLLKDLLFHNGGIILLLVLATSTWFIFNLTLPLGSSAMLSFAVKLLCIGGLYVLVTVVFWQKILGIYKADK